MAFLSYGCGLPDDHEPHWIAEPPPGVLGGHRCAGNAMTIAAHKWLEDLSVDGVAPTEP